MLLRKSMWDWLLCTTLCLAACGRSNPAGPELRDLTALEQALVQSDREFGLKLLRAVNENAAGENVFISPLSVAMALGMTLNGAAGETYDAIAATLELNGMTEEQINQTFRSLIDLLVSVDPEVRFEIANSIWTAQRFRFEPAFLAINQQTFDAEIQALNFRDPQSVDIINRWVADKTAGKIERIIDQIDQDDIMFLINAIYFKAPWTVAFDPDLTEDKLFHLPAGPPKLVPTMNQKQRLPYFEDEQVQVVELGYGTGLFNMTVVLPRPEVDIERLVSELTSETWERWQTGLDSNEVKLALPKFKLEYKVDLKPVLTALGMGIAFSPTQADFSRMLSVRDDVHINEVKHKTYVEVDEQGTEAAAATTVGIGITSLPMLFEMRVDRPFLCLISDRHSGTILFVGKVIDPQP